MYFSIIYRYSDILLKKNNNKKTHTITSFITVCFTAIILAIVCVNMVFVTSASRYHPCYQSRSSMYIRGLIPRNFAELAGAVPIVHLSSALILPTLSLA